VDPEVLRESVRGPASAAVAGLVFGGIFGTVIVLFHSVRPEVVADSATWAGSPGRRAAVDLALGLIPFAGIAFLWFVAVIRARVGSRHDRFFETVFLGSGLLFVAMLFTTAAAARAVLVLLDAGVELPDETVAYAWVFATTLTGAFGARMAAVFMLVTTTMGLRTGGVPRWLALPSYLAAVLLLLTPPLPNLTQFLFPAWVVTLSLWVLVQRRVAAPGSEGRG
jgi:hypothetical protein